MSDVLKNKSSTISIRIRVESDPVRQLSEKFALHRVLEGCLPCSDDIYVLYSHGSLHTFPDGEHYYIEGLENISTDLKLPAVKGLKMWHLTLQSFTTGGQIAVLGGGSDNKLVFMYSGRDVPIYFSVIDPNSRDYVELLRNELTRSSRKYFCLETHFEVASGRAPQIWQLNPEKPEQFIPSLGNPACDLLCTSAHHIASQRRI